MGRTISNVQRLAFCKCHDMLDEFKMLLSVRRTIADVYRKLDKNRVRCNL